jgi:hypothetical protein
MQNGSTVNGSNFHAVVQGFRAGIGLNLLIFAGGSGTCHLVDVRSSSNSRNFFTRWPLASISFLFPAFGEFENHKTAGPTLEEENKNKLQNRSKMRSPLGVLDLQWY